MTDADCAPEVQDGPKPPLRPTRFALALLDRRRRLDYLVAAAIGGLPSIVAVAIGVQDSVVVDGVVWVGFFDKPNLWPQVVVLPLMLFFLRWTFGRVADLGAGERLPPVISLIPEGPDRDEALERLRGYMTGPRTVGLIAIIVVALMALDMTSIVGVYLTDRPEAETDWASMYLAGITDKTSNLAMVFAAYTVQTALFVLRFLVIVMLGAHNLFLLRSIHQRRRAEAGRTGLIPVDLDDEERCLGLRGAAPALNTQVLLIFIGGCGILLSRFANSVVDDGMRWADLSTWPPRLPEVSIVADAGQWILAVAWLVAILLVSMPVLVKLLPLAGPRGPDLPARDFLREFLTDRQWRAAERGGGDVTAALAARFAAHAFWPAGDNRASILFTFWAVVLVIVLYPIRVAEPSLLVAVMAALVAVAWCVQRLGFAVLRLPLRYVDARLVSAPQGAFAPGPRTAPIDLGVFVSYRRGDARGFARLLLASLDERIASGRLFMDLSGIDDGEDFVDAIDGALAASDVALVVIGPDWLDARDADGRRRLENPDDFVAREIRTALERELEIIPLLVDGATMPEADDLPESLRPLVRRQARPLTQSHWDYDVEQLLDRLERMEAERDGP